MSASKPQESGKVRIQPSLNKSEEEFVARRRNSVLQSLKKLQIQCRKDEVPNIALLASGGGQRAMVGLLGSLVQLQKADLLDCVLYLGGVSGSTWCMASLYQEPDWSTKLESVKDKIIQRLSGPAVSGRDLFAKLKKYYYGKDFFSLTDIWAVIVMTTFVKEIDEHTLTEQWDQQSKDPLPIYQVIDKQGKQSKERDPWFEITPHEAGYSLTGAFVDASSFGSQFQKGSKKNKQDEFDMLYLQALCGSALADEDEIKKLLLQKIKDLFQQNEKILEEMRKDLSGGILKTADKKAEELDVKRHTMDACKKWERINVWPFDTLRCIIECINKWIWGRNYNFLHNMTDERKINTALEVPAALLESETRDFADAGLLLNSPYLSVLRKERNIDLIISLDFSGGDPFMTVKDAAKMCRERNIPFPEVIIPSEDSEKPKDFYVFKGQNVPTVIHIPLFNVVNCGDKIEDWSNKYRTFQLPLSAEMITDLMEVAEQNITNNKAKVVEEIRAIIEQKRSRH
ncbi:hypothetical protein R3I93_002583 [Phoxinus phoxinus]|uniref:PLA2c domain-containing protein n=1 Tax=Phoxinus phoxinus TaxID=58324 RepID=A0AAN9DDI2_9TELE